MNKEYPHQQKHRITWMQVIVGQIAALLLIVWMATPTLTGPHERNELTKSISNCRQIIMALRVYSSEHDGKYPDAFVKNPQNSNEIFRELFKAGVLDNEMIFGCPMSPFVPDGSIGVAPDFKQAVEAGENHWAMTAGLDDQASGNIPLVYENPVIATWSPKWNADARETKTRGRAWKLGSRTSHSCIIVGMNDGGVSIQPLESKTGTAVPLKDTGEGVNLFSQYEPSASFSGWSVLDVEVAPER